ncbi:MAG: sterol desaturase family protein [Chlorobi bacterium]|nr:sterol desaturase family protein [Chlorobiota bacterium]MBX7215760.1 sterol desaturase family protein [Candidatus Kapabacteria bacterium]
MARHYVSNKDESVRMFKSDFMEWFSHIHPATPIVLFVPVIVWMLYVASADRGLSWGTILGLFLVGIIYWTLVEYLLHRFVFHYEPKSEWGKRLHFTMHGVHHDYPNDSTRLVMAPAISIPLAFFFYFATQAVAGSTHTPAIMAGLVFGYVCYDTLHYATHHLSMKRGVLAYLKKQHLRHHYGDDSTGYGVTSPLWDIVFGTRDRR